MNLEAFAKAVLLGKTIEEKLTDPRLINWDESLEYQPQRFFEPARHETIGFSDEQVKFPGKGALAHKKERAKALHFFANHELLAIEMMAQALLLFPQMSLSQKKTLVSTIADEQKHFSLYVQKMNDYGLTFGELPLNRFFWSFMEKIHAEDEFFAVISLTFEQANLDFAHYYRGIFEEIGDLEINKILTIVYEDEIRHVARGKHELTQKIKNTEKDLWEYYCELLPEPLTPTRAKGMVFDQKGRQKSGLSSSYIKSLKDYRNDFSITKRKQWKK